MDQPQTRQDPTDALAAAATRLERAVASLETSLGRTSPTPTSSDPALRGELQAALEREQALQEAAAAASHALGQAVNEVRLALRADDLAAEQGSLDLGADPDLGLESDARSLEDGLGEDGAPEPDPEKEPTA